MGETAEGKTSLTVKKMNMEGVHHFRDRFNVPVADADIENCRTSPSRKTPKNTNTCTNVAGR